MYHISATRTQRVNGLVSAKVLVLLMPFGPLPILFRRHWTLVVVKCAFVGLDFSAAFDSVNHKAFIFNLRQVLEALFLVSKLNFYQRDWRELLWMASLMSTEMFRVYRREVYLALYFSYYIPMIYSLGWKICLYLMLMIPLF